MIALCAHAHLPPIKTGGSHAACRIARSLLGDQLPFGTAAHLERQFAHSQTLAGIDASATSKLGPGTKLVGEVLVS